MLASCAICHWRFPLFRMAIFTSSRMSSPTFCLFLRAKTFCCCYSLYSCKNGQPGWLRFCGAGYRRFRGLLVAGRLGLVRHQQHHEAQFLYSIATWAMDTLPQLSEIDWELTKTHETTRNFEWLKCGELFCERRVVQYGPGDSHLQVTVSRQSNQEKHGLQQALQRGEFREYHRRAALLRNHTKTVTLVGRRPLKVSSEVEARIRGRGEDPNAFKALILKARHQREHERFSSWKSGRSPEPLFGHRKFDLPPLASIDEAAVAIGLPLTQEGLLADETVKPLLMMAMGVPASLVDSVWERLKLHYGDSRYPLSLKAYIKRVVNDLCPPKGGRRVQDEIGDDYLTVQRASEELRKDKTTIYRWIEDRMLKSKAFPYPSKAGMQKMVTVVARVEIERLKAQQSFDELVIDLLHRAHKIKRSSAKRAYRRLKAQLTARLNGREPVREEIMEALRDDPKLMRLWEQQTHQIAEPRSVYEAMYGEEENHGQEEPGDTLKAAIWATIYEGNLRIRDEP
jgi:hypothetical protein